MKAIYNFDKPTAQQSFVTDTLDAIAQSSTRRCKMQLNKCANLYEKKGGYGSWPQSLWDAVEKQLNAFGYKLAKVTPVMTTAKVKYDTVEKRTKYMDDFIKRYEKFLSQMHARWQDEKQYEDIKDYSDALMKVFKKDKREIALLSFTKTFDIKMAVSGFPYDILLKVRARTIEWVAIKK